MTASIFKAAASAARTGVSPDLKSKARARLAAHEKSPSVRDTFAAIHRSKKFTAAAAYAAFGHLKSKK